MILMVVMQDYKEYLSRNKVQSSFSEGIKSLRADLSKLL
jgi:hypothetical protein